LPNRRSYDKLSEAIAEEAKCLLSNTAPTGADLFLSWMGSNPESPDAPGPTDRDNVGFDQPFCADGHALSDYIYALRDLLHLLGATVYLHEHDLPVAGQCNYVCKTIRINDPSAKSALMTLAHEGGHWWSYLLWSGENFNDVQREQLAFFLGWYLLDAVGAAGSGRQQVSVDDWCNEHYDLFGKEFGVIRFPFDGYITFSIVRVTED